MNRKKAAATICADLDATDRQLMALFDWTSERQANVYTRKANRTKLAADAAKLLGGFFGERTGDEQGTKNRSVESSKGSHQRHGVSPKIK
ncbi:MAG: hypothetical protein K2Z80_17245 [Xanthobacteraceae bacterium]|nr:hypothetical protein [Xanthobacteraceae bacterium]